MAVELYERQFTLHVGLRAWLENHTLEQAEEMVPTPIQFIELLRDELAGEWFTGDGGADWWIAQILGKTEAPPLVSVGVPMRLSFTVNLDVVAPMGYVVDEVKDIEKAIDHTIADLARNAEDLLPIRKHTIHRNW